MPNEINDRQREELLRSLQNPHPDSARWADEGLENWFRSLPDEDAETLVDSSAGTPIRWVPGEGWIETHE